jgi:zinc transporter ZupT
MTLRLTPLLLGVLVAFSTTIAVLFLKFWRATKDRLFAFFAGAFAMFATQWLAQAVLNPRHESEHYLYLIRLVGFLLIIAGIVSKNRSP